MTGSSPRDWGFASRRSGGRSDGTIRTIAASCWRPIWTAGARASWPASGRAPWSGFLAQESAFRLVKDLEERNLIVPVVGDFAGATALAAIGEYLRARGARVSAFYTSNVEQYLFGEGTFDRFALNVAKLPHDERSVIIRSYFPYGRPHPQARDGYLSVQLLQRFSDFLAAQRAGGYRGYSDLVRGDALRPR